MIPISLTITDEDCLKRDFVKLIKDLNDCGLTNNKLAYRLNCSEGALRTWASGKYAPRYSFGAQLVAMHLMYVTDSV